MNKTERITNMIRVFWDIDCGNNSELVSLKSSVSL